jgi:hypothetical protein
LSFTIGLELLIFSNTEVFTSKPNKCKWTHAEHKAFLAGFEMYGTKWHMISTIVTTQISTQIKNHVQTYHESLLPDPRAPMLKNYAEAQQSLARFKSSHSRE